LEKPDAKPFSPGAKMWLEYARTHPGKFLRDNLALFLGPFQFSRFTRLSRRFCSDGFNRLGLILASRVCQSQHSKPDVLGELRPCCYDAGKVGVERWVVQGACKALSAIDTNVYDAFYLRIGGFGLRNRGLGVRIPPGVVFPQQGSRPSGSSKPG
jgi:hypothetical protein